MFKYSLLIILFLLSACDDLNVKKKSIKTPVPPIKINFIEAHLIHQFDFNEVSFPIWFNPQWLDSLKVKSLNIEKYLLEENDVSDGFDYIKEKPKVMYSFKFKKDKQLKSMKITEYYDDKVIAEYNFSYPKRIDTIGYNHPNFSFKSFKDGKRKKKYAFQEITSIIKSLDASLQFSYPKFTKRDSASISYTHNNNFDKNRSIFILDTAFQSNYAVDHTWKVEAKDKIIFGTPQHPTTSFYQENLIEKTPIIEYEYYSNLNPKSVRYDNTDGITNRFVNYTENGVLTGFTDSLWFDTIPWLIRKIEIDYDSIQLPYQIKINETPIGGETKLKEVYLIKINE